MIILGSGTGVPSFQRGSPGLIVSLEGEDVLFDSGSGTIHKLWKAEVDYKAINYIFYTHLHPDHIADLVPLLFAIKNTQGFKRVYPLHLFGPEGFLKFYLNLSELYGSWVLFPGFPLNLWELGEDELDFTTWQVESKPLAHGAGSIGFRIQDQEGKVLVYSGDTDYCENLVKLAKEADLLVLECSHPDYRKVKGHLTPSLAAEVARQARSKKLLLTHFYPQCDEIDILGICKRIFDGEVMLAQDLMRLKV